MQNRSFKAFTNVAPVSPLVLDDATGTVTRALTFRCVLKNLDGYAAAAGFFQIFDLAVAPTTTVTVPLKSINVGGAGPLPSLFDIEVVLSKGLYVAMSSTEAVYTAVATNFDVWGEVDEWENPISGTTVAGDLTTGVDKLQVYAEATGPKQLVQVDVLNGTGAVVWAMIFATDATPADGAVPIRSIPLTAVATKQTLSFGVSGIPIGSMAGATFRKGCAIYLSSTGQTLTKTTGTTNNIRAYYK